MRRKSSPPLTEELAAAIKKLLPTGMHQHQIAALFGLNQGRISEVKNGKRYPDVSPAAQLPFKF